MCMIRIRVTGYVTTLAKRGEEIVAVVVVVVSVFITQILQQEHKDK